MVAEPAETVPPCGRAQAVTGASALVIKPAAASLVVHFSVEDMESLTAGVRLRLFPSRRSALAFRPLMGEPP